MPRLASSSVSVSQAGYNTVLEGLQLGARMVLIPFSEAGESEQAIRADLLAERRWVQSVSSGEDGLTIDPVALAAAIDRAATAPRPDASTLKLDGANETARLLMELEK